MARGTVTGPAGMGLVNALFSAGRWGTGMLASVGFMGKEGIDSISSGAFGAKRGPDDSMSAEVGETLVGSASVAVSSFAALFLATLAQVCRCLRRVR